MIDDLEQMIKEQLLKDLIGKMSDKSGERLQPKGMAVEVAAPDKSKLAEGLDKAKDVLGSSGDLADGGDTGSHGEEDDEQRLMQLLEDEEDEDGAPGRR